jgi:CDP-diacylglycerol--glycerol-3-phosphate 3-phosphatidyltransferase
LLFTDWVDGKLAIWLRQRTTFGASLDSWADAALYAAILLGCLRLKWDLVLANRIWLVAAAASYALTSIAGWMKYRRHPSYHTRAAKISWLLVSLAVISAFAAPQLSTLPLRLAMGAVVVTNLEAAAMTLILSEWHADVPSIWHAWRLAHRRAAGQ